jgi:hypothetical protein
MRRQCPTLRSVVGEITFDASELIDLNQSTDAMGYLFELPPYRRISVSRPSDLLALDRR